MAALPRMIHPSTRTAYKMTTARRQPYYLTAMKRAGSYRYLRFSLAPPRHPKAPMPRLPVKYDWPKVVMLLRTRRSQSQAEFAESVGCSVSSVSKWERRETAPSPKQRRRIEALSAEAGVAPADWPEESGQTYLFGDTGTLERS